MTRPTDDDRRAAIRLALSGFARDDDLAVVLRELAPLHPRHDTFPGEVLLDLAADALEEAHASRQDPVDYHQIRERYLPEIEFRGRLLVYLRIASARTGRSTEVLCRRIAQRHAVELAPTPV